MQTNLRLLTHANLQRLVHAVDQLYQPIQVPQIPRHFAAILGDLIPGEFHGVTIVARSTNAHDPIRRAAIYPVPAQWESLAGTFSNRYSQFPLRPIRESGNLHEPLALSDVERRVKIEKLDLYHDYYRVLGVEDKREFRKPGASCLSSSPPGAAWVFGSRPGNSGSSASAYGAGISVHQDA
jgi:hypothetical protein